MRRASLIRNVVQFSCWGLLLALGSCSSNFAFAQDELPRLRFVRDPDPAPAFDLKTLDGKELKLDDYRGKVILLNFWATWCGPCRAEIPTLIELQKRYKDRLQVIGLAVDEDDDTVVQKFVASEGINYPIAIPPPEIRVAYGGIAALPTVFVINAEGGIVQKHVGLFDPALYESEVRALLGMPVAARVETFQDNGEIFLKHADRATSLPGVDLVGLSPEQKKSALHKFNAEDCTCGCKFTLAQCRIYDPACQTSQQRTAAILKEISAAKVNKPDSAAPDPAKPASSSSTAPKR
jgi:thiol-disulfide isomerase/thioredoxin